MPVSLLRSRQAAGGLAIVAASSIFHLAYFAGTPISGIPSLLFGVAAFPLIILGFARNVALGNAVPLDEATYVGSLVATWAGLIIAGIGLWRRRQATARSISTIDAAQSAAAPMSRPSRAAISQALGGHPAVRNLAFAGLIYGGFAIILAALWFLFPLGKALALLFVLIPLILLPFSFGTAIGALINAGRYFSPAVDAVERGEIGVTYAVRGTICKGGLVVVDEPNSRIWVNGAVVKFGAVKALDWASFKNAHTLKVTVDGGPNPITTLHFDSADQVQQAYARLGNSVRLNG